MSRDYLPTTSLETMQARAALLKKVRAFFEQQGFLEVETPLLSRDSVVDVHLDPLRCTLFPDPVQPEEGETYWLQTSPEFGMKRLLAGGAKAIYQVCKAFRGGRERGAFHNPEFTMVEWYRVGDDYDGGMELLSQLVQATLARPPAVRLAFRDAFREFVGLDLYASSDAMLLEVAGQFTSTRPASRALAVELLHVFGVEPHLGREAPTILFDYPADQAALAVVRPGQPPLAERFELYVDGVELANGYHELLDARVLLERNRSNNRERQAKGAFPLPENSRLVAAMEAGLPPCSGCALGFDRLVMAATGARSIDDVLAFPIERA